MAASSYNLGTPSGELGLIRTWTNKNGSSLGSIIKWDPKKGGKQTIPRWREEKQYEHTFGP